MHLDMILAHAPSVYDFRNRDDVLFAYLSNSDSVHVSPIFEMPPVGIFALEQHLKRCGFDVQFFNIASQMLRYPEFDVPEFFQQVQADYLGIDLHWLVHCHGALGLLELYKEIHPDAKTVLGGIASTYYHEELIEYPQVDYVIRGFDALLPLEQLLKAKNSPGSLREIPNLTWKHAGGININEMTYVPEVYTAAVDWKQVFGDRTNMTPYNLVIPQAGCEYNCKWCGGSRYFFAKYMGLKKRVQKTPEVLRAELESIARGTTNKQTITMIDFWHEYPSLFENATDIFLDENIDTVHFGLHRLPKVEKALRMAGPVKAVIELSPDSHDHVVAKASGRGTYTMDKMEDFIDALLDNVYSFEIYYMLGLPQQSSENIFENVEYCEHLLKKYEGRRVTPYVCPMLPFLDPGSEIYDHPEQFGYNIYHRTVEDHRQALVSMNWKSRLNYDTQWMSRDELVSTSYEAVRRLTELKCQYGKLPRGFAKSITDLIDKTRVLLADIEEYEAMQPGSERDKVEPQIKARILEYNQAQLSAVLSQQRPVDLGFSKKQWFDTDEAFESAASSMLEPVE
ncbi:MAG: cobalamin-dependent protein [Planctomycetes bacterium]|nr:cobalamin-dependent protein [Planctomycetota bacterium]